MSTQPPERAFHELLNFGVSYEALHEVLGGALLKEDGAEVTLFLLSKGCFSGQQWGELKIFYF